MPGLNRPAYADIAEVGEIAGHGRQVYSVCLVCHAMSDRWAVLQIINRRVILPGLFEAERIELAINSRYCLRASDLQSITCYGRDAWLACRALQIISAVKVAVRRFTSDRQGSTYSLARICSAHYSVIYFCPSIFRFVMVRISPKSTALSSIFLAASISLLTG